MKRVATIILLALAGCHIAPPPNVTTQVSALQIHPSQRNAMWERTVFVLNAMHFQIARESEIEGVIETYPRAGSNLLEPWHPDSVGFSNRLESTLQSIRRKVIVSFEPQSADLEFVTIRVEKEIEDVPGAVANSPGGATFNEANPLVRDLNQTLGQTQASRWIPRGTDALLEAEIARRIREN